MKKNKIIVLVLGLSLMLTFTACTTKNPDVGYNNRNLSTQTRDNRWDNNNTGTDIMEDRDNIGINNSIDRRDDIGLKDNVGIDTPLDNDMGLITGPRDGLDTNINNGMVRPNDTNVGDFTSMHKEAKNIASKITDLTEVNKASVLVSGNDAVVGIDLRGNTKNTMTNDLRGKIEKIVKKENKSINNISITTDTSLMNRIDTMSTSIGNGNIIDNFADEVRDLIRKITPTNMK